RDQIGDFFQGEWRLDIDDDGVFTANDRRFFFGQAGDLPIAGNFYGTGSRIGVFRAAADRFTGLFIIDKNGDGMMNPGAEPFTFVFSLDNNGNGSFESGVDEVFLFGFVSDQFVAGNWAPTQLPAAFGTAASAPLTQDQVDPLFREALGRWAATGLSDDQVAL